ncbi:Isocitrate dehydrogenase (NADP) [Candidatus Xenohaliotis californiensis]|uniref:Isocitrate dehydrogenase [NADP] n=1 Tax=Candidatus Xenohaliotis californiensis TaxID=84677 RepID=A0ABP0ET52_9RICK|nr:Isocitrate dehydrogenase (NADP) [Candidatus Xenohaliotis californiensis]
MSRKYFDKYIPIVEIDGDEMAHVMWDMIKKYLIFPYIDLNIKYFDISVENRDKTNNKITTQAIEAVKKYGIGVKCATITPSVNKKIELKIKNDLPSPNASLRNELGGTVFRQPILFNNIKPLIKNWQKPIVIARHAEGDQYNAYECIAERNDIVQLEKKSNGMQNIIAYYKADTLSTFLLMCNNQYSIKSFAHACFTYAIEKSMSVFLSTKSTVSKIYDGLFEQTFNNLFTAKFSRQFAAKNISYEHRLIDDMVAYTMRSAGGFIWACKNYDGDVQSDFIAQGFGGLSLMQSLLINKKKNIVLAEAAHGTIARHFKIYLKGEETSTNPIGSIFAWTAGIRQYGIVNNDKKSIEFASLLEDACKKTVEKGCFTKDIANFVGINASQSMTTIDFIKEINFAIKNSFG